MVMEATRVVAVAAAAAVAAGVFCGMWAGRRDALQAGAAAVLWFCSSYGMFAIGCPALMRWWRRSRPPQR